MNWQGVGVMVTGATGFVGGWLARILTEKGARVVTIVRDADPRAFKVHPEMWEEIIRVGGDITDLPVIRRALSDNSVQFCFHLAAQASVQSALIDPVSTFETNVRGTWNILEACRQVGGIEGLIFASSDKAYGDAKTLPYTEDDTPLSGIYPYDASKAAAEMIVRSYFQTFGTPVAITRNANTYGGGDLSGHRLIPETMLAVLESRRPVIRSDGSPERDYLYVKDAVAGYLLIAENLGREDIRGEAFNLGLGHGVSVLDLVNRILKITGSRLEPDVRGSAKHEISRQFLSAEKARSRLGWIPQYTLEKGLEETWDWYRSHPDLLQAWAAREPISTRSGPG